MHSENALLAALTLADIETLSPHLIAGTVWQGQVLHQPGHPVEFVYLPTSAVLSVVVPMADFRDVEGLIVGRESAIGLAEAMSGRPATSRAAAQIGGGVLRIDAASLRTAAAASPTLLSSIFKHIHRQHGQLERAMACNALHDAQSRLAKWLLMVHDRQGDEPLPLIQENLAEMLGTQRSTASTLAAALRASGMIDYRRGAIQILDRDSLQAAACGCYPVEQARLAEALGSGPLSQSDGILERA